MSDAEDGRTPEVGSLAEETAKLLGALNGWAREHGAGLGDGLADGLGDGVGHASAAAHAIDEHLATGSAECTICPVCRTVHAVRQLSPEVKAHLASAAASLVHAAAGILATAVPEHETTDRGDVEHIDLDDTGADWPEETTDPAPTHDG